MLLFCSHSAVYLNTEIDASYPIECPCLLPIVLLGSLPLHCASGLATLASSLSASVLPFACGSVTQISVQESMLYEVLLASNL